MAKTYSLLTLLVVVALAGCQAATPALVVEELPPHDFGGPTATQRPATPPVAMRPQPVTPPPAALRVSPRRQTVPAAWIPSARPNTWRWIVIHHSATTTGGARSFDRMHKGKGWDELGYHFVIGNGTDTRDGQVEVGSRWSAQKWGAHAKTPDNRFNNFGIGICLVGNFDVNRPSPRQMAAVTKLVAHLTRTYRIAPTNVLGHGQTGKPTDCPGRYMNIAEIRRRSGQAMADAGEALPFTEPQVASHRPGEELLRPSGH